MLRCHRHSSGVVDNNGSLLWSIVVKLALLFGKGKPSKRVLFDWSASSRVLLKAGMGINRVVLRESAWL